MKPDVALPRLAPMLVLATAAGFGAAGCYAAYQVIEPQKTRGEDVVDSFRQGQPSGSLADVRGKGTHDGEGWTLEVSRRFDTGHDDDAP